jgi:hypothetical protein
MASCLIPKSNKYHTDETIPKSNKYHTDETIPKSNIKIVERGKIAQGP